MICILISIPRLSKNSCDGWNHWLLQDWSLDASSPSPSFNLSGRRNDSCSFIYISIYCTAITWHSPLPMAINSKLGNTIIRIQMVPRPKCINTIGCWRNFLNYKRKEDFYLFICSSFGFNHWCVFKQRWIIIPLCADQRSTGTFLLKGTNLNILIKSPQGQ